MAIPLIVDVIGAINFDEGAHLPGCTASHQPESFFTVIDHYWPITMNHRPFLSLLNIGYQVLINSANYPSLLIIIDQPILWLLTTINQPWNILPPRLATSTHYGEQVSFTIIPHPSPPLPHPSPPFPTLHHHSLYQTVDISCLAPAGALMALQVGAAFTTAWCGVQDDSSKPKQQQGASNDGY